MAAAAETGELAFAIGADLLAPGFLFALASTIFCVFVRLIKDEKDRIRLFFLLEEAPWWSAYAQLLAALSSVFDRYFGKKLFGLRSFYRCLVLAFIYPVVALLVNLGFLTPQTREGARESIQIFGLIAFLILLIFGVIIFFIVRAFRSWLEIRRFAAKGQHLRWAALEYSGYFLVAAIAPIAAKILALYFAKYIYGVAVAGSGVTGAFYFLHLVSYGEGSVVTLFQTAGGAIAAVSAMVVAGASVLATGLVMLTATTVAFFLSGTFEISAAGTTVPIPIAIGVGQSVMLILFVSFIIPFLNGALDWPSWGASRWMMRRLERDAERGVWPIIILHIMIDIALAFLFLAILISVFAVLGDLISSNPNFIWREDEFFGDAEIDPFGAGFWLTAMLLSTLVPTIIHLAAAVGAIVVVRPPFRRIPLRYLEDANPSTLERWITAGYLTVWVLLALGITSAALYGLVYGLSYHGNTLWTLVFDLADFQVNAAN